MNGSSSGGERIPLLAGRRTFEANDVTSGQDYIKTIDWSGDERRALHKRKVLFGDKTASLSNLLHRVWYKGQAWILILLVGIATGTVAAYIDSGVMWLTDLREGYCEGSVFLNREECCWHLPSSDPHKCASWMEWSDSRIFRHMTRWVPELAVYCFLACSFAVCAAWICNKFAPFAAGSGIPEVKTILGGFVIKGFLGMWTLVTKVYGLILAVSAGLSLGKEGPLVHVASCCGNVVTRMSEKYRNNEAKKREILSASAAAGVSVAFGAPIGGVLFSLEEASTYFPHKTMWRSFFCAVVAAITLEYFDPHHTGKITLFPLAYNGSWRWFEIIPFALLGAFGGLVGAAFIRLNVKWSERRMVHWKHRPLVEILLVSLLTGTLSWTNIFMRHRTNDTLTKLFSECDVESEFYHLLCDEDRVGATVASLLWAGVLRFGLTVVTFGTMVPAGLFIPSLAIGASFGRVLGIGVDHLIRAHAEWGIFEVCKRYSSCVNPGVYALIGAASVLGGVTRMTVSLAVIVFELTGGLEYLVPIMLCIMISKWVGDWFGRESIYDEHIRIHRYPFLDGKSEIEHQSVASDVMTRDGLCVIDAHDARVGSLRTLVPQTEFSGFPIVAGGPAQPDLLVGYMARTDLVRALAANAHVSDAARCMFGGQAKAPVVRRARPTLAVTSKSGVTVTPHRTEEPEACDLRAFVTHTPTCIADRMPLDRVVHIFRQLGLQVALVTHAGLLRGIITKKDVLRHLEALPPERTVPPQALGNGIRLLNSVEVSRSSLKKPINT